MLIRSDYGLTRSWGLLRHAQADDARGVSTQAASTPRPASAPDGDATHDAGPGTDDLGRSPAAYARRVLIAAVVAGVALLISTWAPLAGPLLVALTIGAIGANTPVVEPYVVGTAPRLDKFLLRSGIVLLGLKVAVDDILALGPAGLGVVLITVVGTYAATQAVGRLLGLERELTTLIAAGFSICGAAAIAAVESSVRAKPRSVALAVALVTVFGTIMIAVVPALAGPLGLTDEQAAVWAGASIHEVAQVIAAAALVGAGSATVLATATAVKLARVALLAPVQVVSARICHSDASRRQGPVVPLFLVGFMGAVALRSTGVLSDQVLDVAGALTTVLLSAAMFGLGTGIVAKHLWPVPARVLVLATVSTLVAASLSLGLVVALVH